MAFKKRVVLLNEIETSDYEQKIDGAATTQVRKVAVFEDMRLCPITNKWKRELVRGTTRQSFFPLTYRNNELVDNPMYERIESFVGDSVTLAKETFQTTPFNFPTDSDEREKRRNIRVAVIVNESDDDISIHRMLVNSALWELRGTGAEIFDEEGQVLGKAYTEEGLAEARNKHEERRKASIKPFDEDKFKAEYQAANPTAKAAEVNKAVAEAKLEYDTVNGL